MPGYMCGSSLTLEHPHPPKTFTLMPQAPSRLSLGTGPSPVRVSRCCLTQQGALFPTQNHSTGAPQLPLRAGTKQERWVPIERQQHQALLFKKTTESQGATASFPQQSSRSKAWPTCYSVSKLLPMPWQTHLKSQV